MPLESSITNEWMPFAHIVALAFFVAFIASIPYFGFHSSCRLFSAKCARCGIALQPTDFVFRCLNSTYHAQCFSCVYCNHPLKKGDQYLVLDGQVICRADYELLLCNQPMPHAYFDIERSESNRTTPKRPRTILNTQQRRAFKLAFEKSAKPCRKVREQLAKETGLSVRVVQVWFQNQRAKMKKILRKQEVTKLNGATSSEGDAKSIDDSKSNCDSDDGNLFACDIDSDGEELETENSSEEKLKELGNPIDKLYNMQATYFAFT
ncbi:unnamed protein product [Toxocara canis]|uniref:LIM homeobox transcription factor 1-beta n=1 Tax=Toxocara canis TaxID=6265 RepID=A0A183UA06_TOXCA|nr:unnamed protein product [Toxocara canis]